MFLLFFNSLQVYRTRKAFQIRRSPSLKVEDKILNFGVENIEIGHHQRKALRNNFNSDNHTLGLNRKIQKLELPRTVQSTAPGERTA